MNTVLRRSFAVASMAVFALLMGCQTTPNTEAKRDALTDNGQAALARLKAEDPTIASVLKNDNAYGYLILPDAGKGAFIVGGTYGRGVAYEQGKMIGYADLAQASIGAQVGGQSFSELIVFQTKEAMDRFKNNQLSFTANASAVIVKSGVGAASKFENGIAVFIQPTGGAMVDASIGGQKITYVPSDNAVTAKGKDVSVRLACGRDVIGQFSR